MNNIDWEKMKKDPIPFLAAWLFSGFLVVFIPIIHRARKMNQFFQYQGQWNQDEDGNQENGDDGYNGYQDKTCHWWQFRCEPIYYNENGERVYPRVKLCHWWQWRCTPTYYDEDGQVEYREDEVNSPGWFNGWAWNQEMDSRDRQSGDMPRASSGLRFVYVWTLFMFLALVAYGALVIHRRSKTTGLLVLVALFANFSFLSMFLVAQSVETEGRELETYGFFGQLPVLMFMADFWQTLFCLAFGVALHYRNKYLKKEEERTKGNEKEVARDSSYVEMEQPTITISNKRSPAQHPSWVDTLL